MNTIYSLIHIIPDRVLRWIGGGDAPLGDMGVEQANKAAFGVAVSTGSNATSQGAAAIGRKNQDIDDDKDKPKGPGGPGKDGNKQDVSAEKNERANGADSNKKGKTEASEENNR